MTADGQTPKDLVTKSLHKLCSNQYRFLFFPEVLFPLHDIHVFCFIIVIGIQYDIIGKDAVLDSSGTVLDSNHGTGRTVVSLPYSGSLIVACL